MVGIKITAKGTSFIGRAIGFNSPVSDGLLGVYMGGDGELVNIADGGVASSNVGTPTKINTFSTELDLNNYIDTHITPNTAESTLFVVAKRYRGAAYSEPLGCWTNLTAGAVAILGRALILEPNGVLNGILNVWNGSASANANAVIAADSGIPNPSLTPSAGVWRAMVQRISTTSNKTQDLTAGTVAETTFPTGYSPDVRGVESHKIGRPKTSSDGSGKSHVMLAFVFNRALTDSELADLYAYAQGFASRRGITI